MQIILTVTFANRSLHLTFPNQLSPISLAIRTIIQRQIYHLNQAGHRMDQLASQQQRNELAIASVAHNLDRLTTQVAEYVNEAREGRKSLHASIEQFDRLMDYLVRMGDEGRSRCLLPCILSIPCFNANN